jgi:hypothetical protein
MMAASQFDHDALPSSSPLSRHTAIPLGGNRGGSFGREGLVIFGKKVAHDLLLDERIVLGKFGCIRSYGVEMHKEQTNRQTFIFIYRDFVKNHL